MESSQPRDILSLLSMQLQPFIEISFQIMLGRSPSQTELNIHASTLRTGEGRVRFLTNISAMPEFKKHQNFIITSGSDTEFIAQQYRRYFGRLPEPEGLSNHLQILSRKGKRKRVHKEISSCKEARSSRLLWFDLDYLIKRENKYMNKLVKSIFGLSKNERLYNQGIEISLDALKKQKQENSIRKKDNEISKYVENAAKSDIYAIQTTDKHLLSLEKLVNIDLQYLSPNSSRVLERLQCLGRAELKLKEVN